VDTIAISTNLTVEDWRALQSQAASRMLRTETPRGQWLRLGIAAAAFTVLALGMSGWLGRGAWALDPMSVLVGVVIVAAAALLNARLAVRRAAPASNGMFLGPCRYELDRAGLRSARGRTSSTCAWPGVIDVTRTDTHVFVWIERFTAFVIPGRDLPGGLTPEALTEWIAAARAAAAAEPAPELDAGAAPLERAAPVAQPRRTKGPSPLDLLNLVALRGKPAFAEWPGLVATLLTLAAIATWVVFNHWEYGPDSVFYVYGITGVAWYVLGGLVIAWLLARASVPRIALARAVAVCALGAWLVVLYVYLSTLVTTRWLAIGLGVSAVLYALAYFGQAARALTGQAQPRAALAAFVGTLGFFWLTESLYVFPTVWVPGEVGDETAYDAYNGNNVEPLLFAQPDRVDAAVAAVRPSDPGRTELYFVGFAGFGGQRVFAEEVRFAATVIGDRYGSAPRSLLLLNDERDLDSAPFATASTLRRALRGVAEKMTLDDDVLLLALSSHGSGEWELSVTNGALPLTNLTPETLRETLDDAGIRWRVIVISACYAGGFIEALQDPYTVVIAAAAPDRTSFGCSDDRDLTYFGEAFYRDALPDAVSLRDAFASAERAIGEREAAESIAPSRPTAFFGEEIERKLALLDGGR
jgi:hypothetical protein